LERLRGSFIPHALLIAFSAQRAPRWANGQAEAPSGVGTLQPEILLFILQESHLAAGVLVLGLTLTPAIFLLSMLQKIHAKTLSVQIGSILVMGKALNLTTANICTVFQKCPWLALLFEGNMISETKFCHFDVFNKRYIFKPIQNLMNVWAKGLCHHKNRFCSKIYFLLTPPNLTSP